MTVEQASKEKPFWKQILAFGVAGIDEALAQVLGSRLPSLASIIEHSEEAQHILGAAYEPFVDFLSAHVDEIAKLLPCFKESGPLAGKTFCVTGSMSTARRPDLEDWIRQQGGQVKSSVSRQVTHLVSGPFGGASKPEAAARLGVPIISEADLYALAGVPVPKSRECHLQEGEE